MVPAGVMDMRRSYRCLPILASLATDASHWGTTRGSTKGHGSRDLRRSAVRLRYPGTARNTYAERPLRRGRMRPSRRHPLDERG